MNNSISTTNTATATAAPPNPPPQPPRSSFSCERHPIENFTGFCPSCLCERLTTLDSSSNTNTNTPSSSNASTSIKALFSTKPTISSKSNSQLRRSKSFSSSKNNNNNEPASLLEQPHRKSCTSTLFNTHNADHLEEIGLKIQSFRPLSDEFKDALYMSNHDDDGDEIRHALDSNFMVDNGFVEMELNGNETVQEQQQEVVTGFKAIKDYIHLEDKKGSSTGFWGAKASVFSKKWNKWTRKHKVNKQPKLPVDKPISRQFRETQSEIADYGYGRRSCDVDPRFSLDAGRISFDDPRYSFDEPRASCDGYVMGRRSFSRMAPTMVSVMEDAPSSVVSRTDMQIPLEDSSRRSNVDENVPGGSVQTREYYSDSSSRRRKSLDRSSSIRKVAASVVAEIDELKTVSNSATTADYFQGPRHSVGDSNSLRDDCSEIFGLGNGYRDISNLSGERKELKKSKRPWGWRLWGLIQRRNNNKDDDEDSRVNGVERSYSESWRNGGDLRNGFNRNVFRSNSSVSWRNASHIGAPLASIRNSGFEMNGNGRKKRDEFVLEKNRSARFSPSHSTDNGLLRFYLTPLRGSRRVGTSKIKPNGVQSIARNVLRMY